MTSLVIQQEPSVVRVPRWVKDQSSFRRWAKSDDFPEHGWYAWLNGELWVDSSMERLAHNLLKTKFAVVLKSLVDAGETGIYLGDRMLLTNVVAGLSTEPDGMYLGYESLREESVRLKQGEDSLEVEGSPDMVLEVVSRTSVQKDKVVLRDLYWRAGASEYWVVDPNGTELAFDILRHGPKGYVPVRKSGGWVKSAVFQKSFRLTREEDALGLPHYSLDIR